MTTLNNLLEWIREEYAKAERKPCVDDQAAYAAYKVWRRADKAKKERLNREN